MHVGLALPQFDFSMPGERPLRWETVVGCAQRAEQLGFDSLWLADHLFWSVDKYGGPSGPEGSFDPLPALAGLARATSHVRLGTLVLCVPLRPPSVLAKALTTLDVLCGGRLTAGLGAGWYEPEFAAAGVPFEPLSTRLGQLEEAIDILRGLFEGGPFTYRGRHWSVDAARCSPRPRQRPHPPLLLGGRSDGLLDLVARKADGWNAVWCWTPEAYGQRAAVLGAACDRAGRDPATVTRSLGLLTLVGEDEGDLRRRFDRLVTVSPPGVLPGTSLAQWRRGRLVGTVEQVQEQLAEWAAAGVDELIVGAAAVPFAIASLDDLDMIAACVARTP